MAGTQVNDGIPVIAFTPGLADKTPEQKAAEYNTLVGQGFTDAQIRAAADNTFGVQSASDWSYLTNLAGQAGKTSSMGALQQAVADPIEQLYTQYAGRGSDSSGLDYWRTQFGTDVDANEAAIFQRAVAENVAKGVESTATGTNYNPYFTANPDVAAEYMRNTQGMTPEQFALTHYQKFGVNEGRAAPAGTNGALALATSLNVGSGASVPLAWTAPALQAVQVIGGDEYTPSTYFNPNDGKNYDSQAAADAANAAIVNESKKDALTEAWGAAQTSGDYTNLTNTLANTNTTGFDLYTMFGMTPAQQAAVATLTGYDLTPDVITDYRGKTYDTATVLNLANQLAGIADTSAFSGGVFGVTKGSVGFDYDQAARALGRDLSTGEQVLLDSARALIDQGINDISKLGIGDIKTSVTVNQAFDEEGRPTGQYYATVPTGGTDSEGNAEYTSRALTPEEAARIRTEEVTGTGDDAGSYTRRLLDDVVTGRGVVYDGKSITAGNVLGAGSTYTGKGGTSYQITYDDQGKPRFTTTGFSTSDLGSIAPLLQIASFIPGVAPFAMAANAAIAASQGNVFGALASLAGMGGYTNLATGLNVANAIDNKDVGALAGALLSNPSINAAAGSTMLTDTISFSDLGNAANLVINIDNGNWAGALNSVGALTGSSDVRVAASALTIATELGKDNPNVGAILNAATTIQNATSTASNNVNADVVGGITNRVVDEVSTLGDLGTSAYVAAINAGATSEEALAAANTVTSNLTAATSGGGDTGATTGPGVVINAIDAGGPNTSVTTTASTGARDTEWGDLQGAIDTNTATDAARTIALNTISTLPKFNDAFAQARTLLGPNQTFTWNGKQYSTATTAERPDLSTATVQAPTDQSAAETARLNRLNTSLVTGNAPDQSAAETTRLRNLNTNLDLANADQAADAARTAITSLFGDSKTSTVVLQGLSNLQQMVGQTFDFLGGAGASLGLAGSDNVLTNVGQTLNRTGQALQHEAITTAGENVISAVDQAQGVGNKIVAGVKAIIENPLSANYAVVEAMQEALPIGMAARIYGFAGKLAAISTDVAFNAVESGGAARNEAYRESIARGDSEEVANANADRKFWIASTVTALTGAAVDTAVVNKVTKALEKTATKSATTTAKEGGTELVEVAATEVLDALASGKALTPAVIDDIFTKSVVEGLVGGKTATTVQTTSDVGDAVTNVTGTTGTTGTTSTTATTGTGATTSGAAGSVDVVGSTRPGAETVSSTDLGAIGDVTPGGDAVVGDTNVLGAGDAATVTGAADISGSVASQIGAGADVDIVIDTALTTAVNSGANVDISLGSAVSSAINSGADVNAVVAAATNAATNTGNDVTVASDANTVTITNATTNTTTSVDTATGTTTSVNNNTGVTTTTQVDTNTGVTTTTITNADTGVNTTTTTNADTNVDTKTVVNTNTDTTVQVEVDRDTGKVVNVVGDTDSTVIDADTLDLGDGVVIDITTGEQLTPEEVADRKKRTRLAMPKTARKPSGLLVGAAGVTPPYKPSDISETWLGGRFRDVAPFMALAGLLPESNPMFQDQQALSALRRASGLGDKVEKPDSDYFSYGSEPSAAAVLAPYKRGGGVQDPTGGGKIMTSPLMAASGGDVEHKGSHYVQGAGGGQDDLIPAKLADGEYVFDAEIVAALGDGSNKEGARKLDEFREAIRLHKRSGSIKTIPPKAKSPLAYMKGIK